MSIANDVKSTIERMCPTTFSLYSGYGLPPLCGATPVHFQAGRKISEARNERGQCAKAVYSYEDGSRLTYVRKPDNQYALEASS